MKKENKPEIEKYCAYCEHSTPTYDKEQFLCDKKGIVSGGYKCRKFSYDPQKRIPIRKNLTIDE